MRTAHKQSAVDERGKGVQVNIIIKRFKQLQSVMEFISAIALILIVLIVGLQTFTRYVIFYSLPWSEEASRYFFVLMVLMGINIGISQNLMVRIDLIEVFLNKKILKVLEVIRDLICIGVTIVYAYSTLGMISIGKTQKSPAMQIPMNYLYTTLLIGFSIAVLAFLLQFIERHILPGKEPEE